MEVALLKFLSITAFSYPIVVILFRLSILEVLTADEISQSLAACFFGLAMYFNDAEYDHTRVELKMILLFLSLIWTHATNVRGPAHEHTEELQDKIVVVTGGNSGIGYETAKSLAMKGAKIIIGCRDVKKGESAKEEIIRLSKNENVFIYELDLENFDSVRNFAKKLNEDFEKIDILVNNAGSMIQTRQESSNGLEAMLQTNCLSPHLLTLLLVPLLKNNGKVINITSSTSRLHKKFNFEDLQGKQFYNILFNYAHSKFALNQLSFYLAKKLEKDNITVNLVHPGAIKTNITRHIHPILQFGHFVVFFAICKDCESGAQTTIHLASSKRLNGVTGKVFEHCKESSVTTTSEEEVERFVKYAHEIIGYVDN